jgi:hypothetical protein
MANIKISELTTWTGNTTGFYVVVDNSGLTQTYKTTRENLIGDWIDAGTIQSVGWDATTTAPTVGTVSRNNVKYRNVGGKNWEVYLTYAFSAGGSNGSGDYLFTLPGGLQWDFTVPGQQAYAGGVGVNSWNQIAYSIPASGTITNGTVGGQVYPLISQSSSQYKIMTTTYGTAIQPWGAGFYGIGAFISMSFNVTST